jgi:hypothetical protein
MLAATALVFSYLGAYALSGALIAADMLSPWSPNHDPRPRWLVVGFVSLTAAFVVVAALFKWLSRRQLREIDRMME